MLMISLNILLVNNKTANMKKATILFLTTITFFACQKNAPGENITSGQEEFQTKPPSPPPANANPVIAYRDTKKISSQLSAPAIFVMDANGANRTAVYTNYSGQGNNFVYSTPDFPAWSGDGTKLCFTVNSADLYILNISVVNGVPTGSGATKL
jgi:Tol biopolymer transport system component